MSFNDNDNSAAPARDGAECSAETAATLFDRIEALQQQSAAALQAGDSKRALELLQEAQRLGPVMRARMKEEHEHAVLGEKEAVAKLAAAEQEQAEAAAQRERAYSYQLPANVVDAPLAVALRHAGLDEYQIVHDKWTALLSLPQDAVDAIMAASGVPLSDAHKRALEEHATLDGLIEMSPSSSALSFEMWCRVLSRFALSPKSRDLLGTTGVRDALVALSSLVPDCYRRAVQRRRHATHTYAITCGWFCSAIVSLTDNHPVNQQLFGTPAVLGALLALRPLATTADACQWWCGAICNLAGHNRKLLRENSVRDAHAALRDIAASDEAAKRRWDEAAEFLL